MHPGENQKYVNSRQGGPMENSRTKVASNKHENPEYFKRQSDRKYMDENTENVGRGVGCQGANDIDSKQKGMKMMAHKGVKDKGQDVGRGVGQIGKDGKKK
jgi:hypothetical protein